LEENFDAMTTKKKVQRSHFPTILPHFCTNFYSSKSLTFLREGSRFSIKAKFYCVAWLYWTGVLGCSGYHIVFLWVYRNISSRSSWRRKAIGFLCSSIYFFAQGFLSMWMLMLSPCGA